MSAPRHYAPWYRQLAVDIRPWLFGITLTTLCAAIVTLLGLLMVVQWNARVTGPLVILVGLVAVVLAAAFWAAGKATPEREVSA